MLEIDKIKERFPVGSADFIKEFAHDFSKPDKNEKAPPNPPFLEQKVLEFPPEKKELQKNP